MLCFKGNDTDDLPTLKSVIDPKVIVRKLW